MGENQKALSLENRVVELENDLEHRKSHFYGAEKVMRSIIKYPRREEKEVRTELLNCLRSVAEDETGKRALFTICKLSPELIKKVHMINVAGKFKALDKRVEFHLEERLELTPNNQLISRVVEVPSVFFKVTQKNQEKALDIVNSIVQKIELDERLLLALSIHSIHRCS